MSSIFSIALTGLNAAQAGLTTTSHNITNASVSGYTRQETVQTTASPLKRSTGFYGQGTSVETVQRVYSEYLNAQVLAATSAVNSVETYYNEISSLDNILGDETAGLSTALNDFFASVSEVAATPSDVAARQAMISASQTLVSRFNTLQSSVDDIQTGINTQIKDSVSEINSLASQIADANMAILKAQAGSGDSANDLLDARDKLISKLSELVNVSTYTDSNGVTSVAIGNGQSLVEGTKAYELTVTNSTEDSSELTISISVASGATVTIPNSYFSSGTLGGLLDASDEIEESVAALGRIAVSLTVMVNAQNKLGQDLDGEMGGNYFTALSPTVQNLPNDLTGTESTSSITGTYTAIGDLTTDSYVLEYDGTTYTLTDESDGSVVYSGTSLPGQNVTQLSGGSSASVSISATSDATGMAEDYVLSYDGTNYTITSESSGDVLYSDTTLPASIEGIEITVTGSMAAGDSFLLQPSVVGISLSGTMSAGDRVLIEPTEYAAGQFALATTDTSLIAAASPVSVSESSTNTGTGAISQPVAESLTGILSSSASHLASDITLTFDATNNEFVVTGATPTTIAYDPSSDASGTTVTLMNPNISFTISGRPADGDTFTITSNADATDDATNANALYALMSKDYLLGGSATLSEAYTQLVDDVASVTGEASTSLETQQSLLDSAVSSQQSLSGVNLDEEAAKLLEYQQAYQAAARCISVAQTLFDDIISIMS